MLRTAGDRLQRDIRGTRGAWLSPWCPLACLATQTTDRRQQRGQAVQRQRSSPAILFIDSHPSPQGGRRGATHPQAGERKNSNNNRTMHSKTGSPSRTTACWEVTPEENRERNITKRPRRPQPHPPGEQQRRSRNSLGSGGCCPPLHTPTLRGLLEQGHERNQPPPTGRVPPGQCPKSGRL